MGISNRAARHILVCVFGTFLCGTTAAAGDGVNGIARPSQFLTDVADDHSVAAGPLHGVDFSFAQGTNSAFGTVRNEPGSSRVFLNGTGVQSAFGLDPGAFGITDYKTKSNLAPVTGGYAFELKQLAVHQSDGTASSVATGGGVWAQYRIFDPTRDATAMIDVETGFDTSGLMQWASTRSGDSFSLNLEYTVEDASSGSTITNRSGSALHSGGNLDRSGLFADPAFTFTKTDLTSEVRLDYSGNVKFTFSVQNGSRFNTSLLSFFGLSGAPGGNGTFTYDSSDSFGFSLSPAVGFETAQLTLVPEPDAVLLFLAGLAVVATAARRTRRMQEPRASAAS